MKQTDQLVRKYVAHKNMADKGHFSLKKFEPQEDSAILHEWVTQAYAKYWGMLDHSERQVQDAYEKTCASSHTQVFLGYHNDQPAFLLEVYQAKNEAIAQHIEVEDGDLGMHILMAPPLKPIAKFSYCVFMTIMEFIFEKLEAKRILVEPDHENSKIHRLNKQLGFIHSKEIKLPDKQAYLATCSKLQFRQAIARQQRIQQSDVLAHTDIYQRSTEAHINNQPQLAVESINEEIWAKVNRLLVRKQLSEFCHERLLAPSSLTNNEGVNRYRLTTEGQHIEYSFNAQLLALNHWHIATDSIEKFSQGKTTKLDAVRFIIEFQKELQIDVDMLPTYLEEISSTLCSSAYKHHKDSLSCKQLSRADYQTVEAAMTEGHPAFIANNGRIGFGAADFRAYAPEAGAPISLIWLAAHKRRAQFSCAQDLDYQTLINEELDATTRAAFKQTIQQRGADADDYLLMPVHPWQWFNKLAHIYAPDIAAQDLICLGYGDDAYLAQQSIRTFFNISQPHKRYVKTALSILNMGFMRGLSSYYMRTTPAINDWLQQLVSEDNYLQQKGFSILREVAAVGYSNPYYENEQVKDSPYKKMLAALWRENPLQRLQPQQKIMTMASLLHVDTRGDALVCELIASSGKTTDAWLTQYFDAYLTPLLQCFYRHKLVFMPHGENLILVMEQNTPVAVLMKDIGEEICLLNSSQDLPENVRRIAIEMPSELETLSFFTDVFDNFFRYLAHILHEHAQYSQQSFWQLVARCIIRYQQDQPGLAKRFEQHDLFSEDFAHSCLNRLQLNNNKQMVDLSDPANSLKFAGTLRNPIAKFRPAPQASLANETGMEIV